MPAARYHEFSPYYPAVINICFLSFVNRLIAVSRFNAIDRVGNVSEYTSTTGRLALVYAAASLSLLLCSCTRR